MAAAARCILCDHEVESAEGLKRCPKCGTTRKPVDPAEDVTIRINTKELKTLVTFAERCALSIDDEDQQAMVAMLTHAIGLRIKKQLPPGAVIFLADQIADLKRRLPTPPPPRAPAEEQAGA